MPRHPRITFPGAHYHVSNQGSHGTEVFGTPAAARFFEQCLLEIAERTGWILFAYAITRNRFDFAIETPRANLVEGLHWLETTFAMRLQRHHGRRGHVFQGRYSAVLIQPGRCLARVVNSIHLAPLRTGIVAAADLERFRWSSLPAVLRHRRPPATLCVRWLPEMGLSDSRDGRRAYRTLLGWMADDPDGRRDGDGAPAARGWAIGTPEWRRTIHAKHGRRLKGRRGAVALGQDWTDALAALMARHGRTRAETRTSPKGARWKVRIALDLRRSTSATHRWIALHLSMGTPGSVSVHLSRFRRELAARRRD